jgi:hypothetical protein
VTKRYRYYFNRWAELPQVWSVDQGDQTSEINVIAVRTEGCVTVTGCDPSETINRDRPKVWVEAVGVLSIENGIAVIRG